MSARFARLLIFTFEFAVLITIFLIFLDALVYILLSGSFWTYIKPFGIFEMHAYPVLLWFPIFLFFYPKFGFKSFFVLLFAQGANEILFNVYYTLVHGFADMLSSNPHWYPNFFFNVAVSIASFIAMRPKISFSRLRFALFLIIVADYFIAFFGHYQVTTTSQPSILFSDAVDVLHLTVFPILVWSTLSVSNNFSAICVGRFRTLLSLPSKLLSQSPYKTLVWFRLLLGQNFVISVDGLRWRIRRSSSMFDSHGQLSWGTLEGTLWHESKFAPYILAAFKTGLTFVDVGANCGGYALRAAKSGMSVFAFEPNSDVRKVLLENAALNGITRDLSVLPFALSSENCKVGFVSDGASSRISSSSSKVVEARTLDSFLLLSCDVLKIDVEGFELKVLRGAVETLRRCKPVVFVECHKFARSLESVRNFLTSFGYQSKVVVENEYAYFLQAQMT